MARACEICGKQAMTGNSISRRGAPKRTGGAGRKITGITRRRFRPNLQRVRVMDGKTPRTMRVCTRCIRSDRVLKVV